MTERTYRIGEAARLLDLEGYVLRYWETEFAQLRPGRTPKGQRVYSEADLALLRRIRELLHERGMTIEGARRVLAGKGGSVARGEDVSPESGLPAAGDASRQLLLDVEQELARIQEGLRRFPRRRS